MSATDVESASHGADADIAVSRRLVWAEVGLVYVLYQLLIAFFIVLPPLVLGALGIQLGLRDGTSVTLGCTLVAEMIALGLLALWMRRRNLSFADIGLGRRTTAGSVWLAVIFGVCYAAYTISALGLAKHLDEVSMFRLWGALVGVMGAAVEEIVFRGFLLTEMQRARITPKWQVVTSALLFSFVHMGFSLAGMLATFVMGVMLGIAYIAGRRSLTAPIVGHALINVVIEPWLLLWLITFYASQHQ